MAGEAVGSKGVSGGLGEVERSVVMAWSRARVSRVKARVSSVW